MIQGQIEDSPTDTDSDDSWFNQPRRRCLEFDDNTDPNVITRAILVTMAIMATKKIVVGDVLHI